MRCCPDCGFTLDPSDAHCPRCEGAAPSAADPKAEWQVIARFGNAAEAGYFAYELASLLDVDPRITERDVLDEFSHAWRTTYLLAVPAGMVEPAAQALRSLVETTSDDQDELLDYGEGGYGEMPLDGEDRRPERELVPSRINWVPIVLTLTAGTFVLWAARKPAAGPVGRAASDDLWKVLVAHPEPWVQQGRNGRVVRQLSVDPDRDQIFVHEDLDGDGVFESISTLRLRPQD